MKLTAEEAREIVWHDNPEWVSVQGTKKLTDHSRWSVMKEEIFHFTPADEYYRFNWSVGATEYQEEAPFGEDEYEPIRVRRVERMSWIWEDVK